MNLTDVWGLASIAAKFLTYLGVLGSVGQILTSIVFGRELAGMRSTLNRQAAVLAAVALLASALGFLLKGAVLTGSAAGMADREMLGLLWATSAGTASVLRGAGLVLLLAGLAIPGIGHWIACAGGILALWSFSQIGHVQDAGLFLLQTLLFVHLAGIAFWIGILSPLRTMAGQTGTRLLAASLGQRFGQIAAFVVPALALAGIVLAWQLLGSVTALLGTEYGLALLAKVAGVLLLLGAAAANKLRLVPAMMRGDPDAATRLRQSIAIEWAAICLILLLTAILTTSLGAPAPAVP